jgi:hypothetical protein
MPNVISDTWGKELSVGDKVKVLFNIDTGELVFKKGQLAVIEGWANENEIYIRFDAIRCAGQIAVNFQEIEKVM